MSNHVNHDNDDSFVEFKSNYDYELLNKDFVSQLKASRYYMEPFDEPLDTNVKDITDDLTPFDLLVMVYPYLEDERIDSFKRLIIKFMKKFPLTEIYPELVELLYELQIEYDYNLFYKSDQYLGEFSIWIQIYVVTARMAPFEPLFNQDVISVMVGYMIGDGE